jgi:hypothetical protein
MKQGTVTPTDLAAYGSTGAMEHSRSRQISTGRASQTARTSMLYRIGLFRTSRAKLYQKEERLLLNALTRSLLQKHLFQDSFSSTGSAEDPKTGYDINYSGRRCSPNFIYFSHFCSGDIPTVYMVIIRIECIGCS